MHEIKLMIIEDDESDLKVCRDSIEIYQKKRNDEGIGLVFKLIECKSVDDALNEIDGSFDGAIVDLKFSDGDNRGKDVLEKIKDSFFRIPVIILTGTPDSIGEEEKSELVKVLKKGEADYQKDILDVFFEIYNTGLTKIMGGRGKIEEALNKVFVKNLLPQLRVWEIYGRENPTRTEKALLRFTLNHLVQILDEDENQCYPEEVYIYPPLSDGPKTGSIVRKREGNDLYVLLSPACDLVVRSDGNFKTDRILLVEVEERNSIIEVALNGITQKDKKKNKLNNLFGNNYTDYFHWLPETDYFYGGFINFRKISTCTIDQFENAYNQPHIQISPHFVKDILSRFSSYYARQGQPEIDRNKIIREVIATSGETE
ncbi:MAG: response regulator [Candidatus Zhuqueibacterota bacterium]